MRPAAGAYRYEGPILPAAQDVQYGVQENITSQQVDSLPVNRLLWTNVAQLAPTVAPAYTPGLPTMFRRAEGERLFRGRPGHGQQFL